MNDPASLSNAFWLIPVIILLTMAGFYFLVRAWREQAQQEARPISGELRRLESSLHALQASLAAYSPDDPAPFGPPAAELHALLTQSGERLGLLRGRYIEIQERLPRKSDNPFQSYLIAPFLLFGLRSDLRRLKGELAGLAADLEQAAASEQVLEQAGWQAALAARKLQQAQYLIEQRLEALRERHARGPTFEAFAQRAGQVTGWFQRLPPYFLGGSQEQVLEQAGKDAVIQAHQLLADVQPEQTQMEQQLRGWEGQLAALDEKSRRLRRRLDAVEQVLVGLPDGLDQAPLSARHKQLGDDFERLRLGLSRPALEALGELSTQLDGLEQAALALDDEVSLARRELAELNSLAAELAAGLVPLTEQYTALGKAKNRPILWGQGRTALAQLTGPVNAMSSHSQPRSPELVREQLAQAQELKRGQLALADYFAEIAAAHAELLALLDGLEISQGALWCQSAKQTLPRLPEYHPDNWPRLDDVKTLPAEIKALSDGLSRLGAGSAAEGIPEAELSERLAAASAWVAAFQAKRARLNMVEGRLAELQYNESQARVQLELAGKALAQARLLAGGNPVLEQQAGKEIELLQGQVQRLTAELDRRGQGLVDAKAQQADGLERRVEHGLAEWLDRLNRELDGVTKALTASLTRLDAIAPLLDPPVEAARRALTPEDRRQAGVGARRRNADALPDETRRAHPVDGGQLPTGDPRPAQSALDELILELKRRSEFGQSAAATLAALQEIEKTVVESHAAAAQERQETQDLFSQVAPWLRGAGAWPPASVDVSAENAELNRLDERWQALRTQPVKALEAVRQLGDLARQYHRLAEQARVQIERGGRDQGAVQKLESELNQYLHQWEAQLDQLPDNPLAQEEIGELVNGAERELQEIQAQARQGALDYNQALRAVQNLHRRVRLYQAVLDETHVIDVNGRVIASRDSKRTDGEW